MSATPHLLEVSYRLRLRHSRVHVERLLCEDVSRHRRLHHGGEVGEADGLEHLGGLSVGGADVAAGEVVSHGKGVGRACGGGEVACGVGGIVGFGQ